MNQSKGTPTAIVRTLALAKPIVNGSISTLEFREFTVRELRTLPLKVVSFGDLLSLTGVLTDLPADVIDQLSPEDVGRAIEITNDLAGPFLVAAAGKSFTAP